MLKNLVGALLLACVSGRQRNAVYMRHSALEDQTAAATGYIYHTDSNGPVSYMHFNSATGNSGKFGYPPITLGHYAEVPKLQPAPFPYLAKLRQDTQPEVQLPEALEEHEGESDAAGTSGFEEEHGSKHSAEDRSSKGEKGSKGYKNAEGYEKGSKGDHDEEAHEGHYSKSGGDKQGSHEESEHYKSENESAKGSKGGSSGESSSHKKGSKTTGFHKVYSKDEYKKDHTFYDESDSKGHYDKYGNFDARHSSAEGARKKGDSSDASHRSNSFGKKGNYDKGHHNNRASGFKGEEGDEEYYSNHADYADKGRSENEKSYGH